MCFVFFIFMASVLDYVFLGGRWYYIHFSRFTRTAAGGGGEGGGEG